MSANRGGCCNLGGKNRIMLTNEDEAWRSFSTASLGPVIDTMITIIRWKMRFDLDDGSR